MRKKIFFAIFIFLIISSIAINVHAYFAFGTIPEKGKVDRIEYKDVKSKETNSWMFNATESKGTVYVEDNDTTYNNTYIKVTIKDPTMFLKGSEVKAEEKNYIQVTITDNVPVVKYGGLLYPDGNWLVSGGDPVYIGDETAIKNDTRKRIGAYINSVKALQNDFNTGYTMNFNDFTAIYAANNWIQTTSSGVAKYAAIGKVTLKIIPIIKDRNIDENIKVYACGENSDVVLIEFKYKLKTYLDKVLKEANNLSELSSSVTGWQDAFRKKVQMNGLFTIDEENITNFGEGNYKTVGKYSKNRVRTKNGTANPRIIFKVTASRDGNNVSGIGTIKKGEKYEVTFGNLYWLPEDEAFYYKIVWKRIEDAEGNKVDDPQGDQGLADLTESEEISFLQLAATTAGDERGEKPFVAVVDKIENYIPTGDIDPADETQLLGKVNVVLSTIVDIGIVIAVIMIAVIGIKYMLGSVEEKAEYKKTLVPYVVGVIMLLGITTIVKILQALGENINNI